MNYVIKGFIDNKKVCETKKINKETIEPIVRGRTLTELHINVTIKNKEELLALRNFIDEAIPCLDIPGA